MELGELITKYRKQSGLTIEELSEKSGVAKGTLNKIIGGVTKAPTLDNMKAIAHALGKKLADFDDDRDQESYTVDEQTLINKYRAIDQFGKDAVNAVLDCENKRCIEQKATRKTVSGNKVIQLPMPLQPASAGTGEFADDESTEYISVVRNKFTAMADYILRVHGDSMEPDVHDGELLLVRIQPAVEYGEPGIFIHQGERYVKKFFGDHLKSLNGNYQDIAVDESTRCIGKVVTKLSPEWIVE